MELGSKRSIISNTASKKAKKDHTSLDGEDSSDIKPGEHVTEDTEESATCATKEGQLRKAKKARIQPSSTEDSYMPKRVQKLPNSNLAPVCLSPKEAH